MKKLIAAALVLVMALSLCACGNTDEPQQTAAPQQTEAPATQAPETTAPQVTEAPATEPQETEAPQAPVEDEGVFSFTFEGAVLTPGTVYDAAALPEPTFTYEVPSCAIEGTDNVYSFDTVEITAFNDGTQEIIYAIAILDPNVCTDEGLYLGDDVARVVELYGENYQEDGTAMIYTKGNTQLIIIVQNDFVVDMEFSWITE